ncbi:MAG: hypothetical protein ACE5H3_02335 [Planctomycetota bacterium]
MRKRSISWSAFAALSLGLGGGACQTLVSSTEASLSEPLPLPTFEEVLRAAPRFVETRPFRGEARLSLGAGRDWEPRPTTDTFRLASWILPGSNGPASLTVYWLDENLASWAGEFDVGGRNPLLAARTMVVGQNGIRLTRMQLRGRYLGLPLWEGATPSGSTAWALDAGILETPQGTLYLKVLGPARTLEDQKGALDRLYASLRVVDSPGKPEGEEPDAPRG